MLEEKLTAGIFLKKTENQVKQDNLVDNISNYIYDYELDIFLGPEWLFMPKDRLYTKKEKEDLIEKLAKKTESTNTLIIPGSIMWFDDKFFYNTAPILSNGELLGEYHKELDGGSRERATKRDCRKDFFTDGKFRVFKWRGYKIGVEICADRGILYQNLKENNLPFLDLYFFVSCGLTFSSRRKKDIPIKYLKYCLCSDGYGPKSEVLQKREQGQEIVLEPIHPKENLITRLVHPKNHLKIYELLLTRD